jgi:hypothetical protein
LFGEEWLHSVLLVLVAVVALWSLLPAFLSHRHRAPLVLAAIGVPLLLMGVMYGGAAEAPLTITGGFVLMLAHGLNWRCLASQGVLARGS